MGHIVYIISAKVEEEHEAYTGHEVFLNIPPFRRAEQSTVLIRDRAFIWYTTAHAGKPFV
jgi:hypothetical protein